MKLIIAFIVSAIFVALFKKPLAKWPIAFYALAVVIDIIFLSELLFDVFPVFARALSPYMFRCLFAFGLLAIVMFTGVLAPGSRLRRYLAPIRGELSIFATILVAGHAVNYIESYIAQILDGFAAMSNNLIAGLIVSVILVILLAVLAVTSFSVVRRRMTPGSWKKLQRWAYVFFGFAYIHIMLLLLPSALSGGQAALMSAVVYNVLFIVYIVMRMRRMLIDGKDTANGSSMTASAEV